jgi:hypothetical protein
LENKPERSFHELNLLELPFRVIFRINDSFELLLSADAADGTCSKDSYESPVKIVSERE